jgi:hypothetical protein
VELVSVTHKEGMVLPHFPLQQEHVQFGEYSGSIMNAANNPNNFTLDPTTGRISREGVREPTYGDDEYSTTTGMSTISSKKTKKKQRTSGTRRVTEISRLSVGQVIHNLRLQT